MGTNSRRYSNEYCPVGTHTLRGKRVVRRLTPGGTAFKVSHAHHPHNQPADERHPSREIWALPRQLARTSEFNSTVYQSKK
jgi:hypothetical protein